ncbi:bHLH/Zip transcription factor [Exophiala xenobiotica]|nr:bHLH/Zip transcription factor [Exophiala xenobiotica]KAK5240453.1 bHLH/Zip transcription factor [Exophiala xenobiotica]KAK5344317.1 bHLH/Zip transcription factor [Exophiala xenobiotica]
MTLQCAESLMSGGLRYRLPSFGGLLPIQVLESWDDVDMIPFEPFVCEDNSDFPTLPWQYEISPTSSSLDTPEYNESYPTLGHPALSDMSFVSSGVPLGLSQRATADSKGLKRKSEEDQTWYPGPGQRDSNLTPQQCGQESTRSHVPDVEGSHVIYIDAVLPVDAKIPDRISPLPSLPVHATKLVNPKPNMKVKGGYRHKAEDPKSPSRNKAAPRDAKHAHSVVERRYRDKLNGKIVELRSVLSEIHSTGPMAQVSDRTTFFVDREHARRDNKSDILTDAINYVHQSEIKIRHLSDQIVGLETCAQGLERLLGSLDPSVLQSVMGTKVPRINVLMPPVLDLKHLR